MAIYPDEIATDLDLVIAENNNPAQKIIADHHNLLKDEVIAFETQLSGFSQTSGALVDYSTSTTIGGFNTPNGWVYYIVNQNIVMCNFYLYGTCPGAPITFTMPFSCTGVSTSYGLCSASSGGSLAQPAMVTIDHGSSTVYIYKDWTGLQFPSSFVNVNGGFFYPTADDTGITYP